MISRVTINGNNSVSQSGEDAANESIVSRKEGAICPMNEPSKVVALLGDSDKCCGKFRGEIHFRT